MESPYLYQRNLDNFYLKYSQVCINCLDECKHDENTLVLCIRRSEVTWFNFEELYRNSNGFVFNVKKYEKYTGCRVHDIYMRCIKCEKTLFNISGYDVITETVLEDYFRLLYSTHNVYDKLIYESFSLDTRSLLLMKLSLIGLFHFHLFNNYRNIQTKSLPILHMLVNGFTGSMILKYEDIEKDNKDYFEYYYKQSELVNFSKDYDYLSLIVIFRDLLIHPQMINYLFKKYEIINYFDIKKRHLPFLMDEIYKRISQLNYHYTDILFNKYFKKEYKDELLAKTV